METHVRAYVTRNFVSTIKKLKDSEIDLARNALPLLMVGYRNREFFPGSQTQPHFSFGASVLHGPSLTKSTNIATLVASFYQLPCIVLDLESFETTSTNPGNFDIHDLMKIILEFQDSHKFSLVILQNLDKVCKYEEEWARNVRVETMAFMDAARTNRKVHGYVVLVCTEPWYLDGRFIRRTSNERQFIDDTMPSDVRTYFTDWRTRFTSDFDIKIDSPTNDILITQKIQEKNNNREEDRVRHIVHP